MPLTSEDIETLANTSAKLFLPLFDADLPLIVDPDHEEEETPFVTAEMTERLNKLRSLPH